MLSGPIPINIVKDTNSKFILQIFNPKSIKYDHFGTFNLKTNAEKFAEFLLANKKYIKDHFEGWTTQLKIQINNVRIYFGTFKVQYVDAVKNFLKDNIIASEGESNAAKDAPKRTSSGSVGGGGGGGGGAPKRTSSGSVGDGGGDGEGEQIFNIRVSQDHKPQRGGQRQQGLLPQYLTQLLDSSEHFQEQTAQKQKQGGGRYLS